MKLILWLVCLLNYCLFASTYYVNAVNGDDRNIGSLNEPWATIQYGVDNISSEDILILLSDFNLTSTVVITTDNITVTSLAMQFSHPDVYSTSSLVTKLFEIQSDYVTISLIELTQCYSWGIWIYGNYNRIQDCVVTNTKKSAIVIQGDNNYIGYNQVYGVGWEGEQNANCIDIASYRNVNGYQTADYNIIEHNLLFNNMTHFAVNLFPDPASTWITDYMTGNIIKFNYIDSCYGGIYMRYQKEFVIYSNAILNSVLGNSQNGDTNGNAITFDSDSNPDSQFVFDTDGGRILNNTIGNTLQNGLRNIWFTDIEIKNNLFYDIGNYFIATSQTSSIDLDYNYYFNENPTIKWLWVSTPCTTLAAWRTASGGDMNASANDPVIRNSALEKFYQIAGSSMIDGGTTLTGVETIDINGHERGIGDGWDIGAYEFFDYTTPVVSSASVVTNDIDSITFSCTELIYDIHYALNINNYIIANISTPSQEISITAILQQGNSVGVKTQQNHIPGDQYTISFTSGVQDTNGNPVSPTSLTYTAPLSKVATSDITLAEYTLIQNYPNPFNPVTKISYSLKAEGLTSLEIYNIVGEKVKTVVNEFQQAGIYEVLINASDISSGIYIYRLISGPFTAMKKMSLLK